VPKPIGFTGFSFHCCQFHAFSLPGCMPPSVQPEILWTWDDCKNNPLVGVSSGNVSCPCDICHVNGTILSKEEWKVICQSTFLVAHTHLQPLTQTSQPGANQSCKKMYFKCFFSKEWAETLWKLEPLAPLLSLCAGEYKAYHTLGAVLHNGVFQPKHDAPSVSHASTPSSLGPLLQLVNCSVRCGW
jgi:hypothetical protein